MASAAVGTAFQHLRDFFRAGTATRLGDGQLLARFSGSNDAVAFETLVARHVPMVLATCPVITRTRQVLSHASRLPAAHSRHRAHPSRRWADGQDKARRALARKAAACRAHDDRARRPA
jgi:CTP:molybdopterin cytidylyltransferase MocA